VIEETVLSSRLLLKNKASGAVFFAVSYAARTIA
jgi:hypothetical protein